MKNDGGQCHFCTLIASRKRHSRCLPLCGGRTDRRKMGIFDFARCAQRPSAFYEEFQAGLGIARNILSDRLAKMVAGEILQRSLDPIDKRRVIYSLTAKGEGLLPVVLALRQWGDEWGYGRMKVVLADRRDRKPVRKICVQAHDGRPLDLHDLTWIDYEEAGSRR